MDSDLIIVLDVGSTNLKCHFFTKQLQLLCEKRLEVPIIVSNDVFVEINPDTLWTSVVSIVNDCLRGTYSFIWNREVHKEVDHKCMTVERNVDINRVACFGISCHRGSFITWDRNTGIPYHNFITWKDLRARSDVQRLNNNFIFKVLKWFAYAVYLLSGSSRFLTASSFKFTNAQVNCRLLWALKHYAPLKRGARDGHAMFGTLDTWLLYRLTAGRIYCTDISMASSTGLFDPYTLSWNKFMKFIGLRVRMPDVVETGGYHFGEISPDIWGVPLPITCSIADQAAALYGSRCFSPGELKITLGTGAFLDVNVGYKAVVSKAGLYPLVGWKYDDEIVHTLEATCHDCGTVIDWLTESNETRDCLVLCQIFHMCPIDDFCNNVEELNVIAESMQHTENVYFVPAFSGLQMPIDDATAGSGFIGVNKKTKKEDLIMAVLEAVVFRIYEMYELYSAGVKSTFDHPIKINGGVSKNDYICQSLADICHRTVRRSKNVEASALGVAALALKVLDAGVKDFNPDHDDGFQTFLPDEINGQSLRRKYVKWRRAVSRFLHWRQDENS